MEKTENPAKSRYNNLILCIMADFRVKFRYAYTSHALKKKITYVGQIIDVESNSSKPTERDVVKALEKINGVSSLQIGISVTMWDVI